MNSRSILLAIVCIVCSITSKAQGIPEVERALQRQEYQKAIELADKMLATDPKNDKIWYLKGMAQFENGAVSDAKGSFQKGINFNGRDPWNLIGLGGCFAKENNFEEAKKNLDKAVENNKVNASDVSIGVADAYLNSEKKEFQGEAEKILTRVISVDPKNVKAYISLGDLYLNQRIPDLALVNYQQAIKLDPTFMKGYLRAGQLQLKAKKYNEGAAMFQEAIKIDPTFAPAYKELGELWYMAGKYENAKENYRKYVELTQNDCGARQRYGAFLYLTKNYDDAIKELEEVRKCNPTSVIPYRLLGYCYIEKKEADKALENMNRFVSSAKPEELLTGDYEAFAKIYEQKKDTLGAVDNYMKAYQKDTSHAEFLLNAANLQYSKKDYASAESLLAQYISTGYGKFKEYFQWANTFYYRNDTAKADTAFGTVIATYPNTYVGYLFRARVKAMYDPKSEQGLAKPYYEKVYESLATKADLTPKEKKDLLEAGQYLGFYFYSHGQDCAGSAPYWKKVLEFDPENQGAKDVLKFCKM